MKIIKKFILITLIYILSACFFSNNISFSRTHSSSSVLPTQVLHDKNISRSSSSNQKDSKNLPPASLNRQALRFKVDESIEWYSSSPHIIKLIDISTKGLGALTDGEIQIDEIVSFKILYKGLNLIVDGRTARCDEQTKVCGFEFTNMDPVTANCFLYMNLVMQNKN